MNKGERHTSVRALSPHNSSLQKAAEQRKKEELCDHSDIENIIPFGKVSQAYSRCRKCGKVFK